MIDRFSKRRIIKNNSVIYSDYFKERDKNNILHYNTCKLNFPSQEELNNIAYFEHVWTVGDRLYKLSEKYCGGMHNWWIILQFNKINSEMNIKKGDTIKIPSNIEDILAYFI